MVRSIPLLLALALLGGCVPQRYALEVYNTGAAPIDAVQVWYGDRFSSFGVIIAGVSATRQFVEAPPPDVAELRWVDAEGIAHAVRVDLSGVVPRDYEGGQLTFEIDADGAVKARFQFIPDDLF